MTKEQRREYDRRHYQQVKDKKQADYYFRRWGIKLKQRPLPLELPPMKLVRFFGIEIDGRTARSEG